MSAITSTFDTGFIPNVLNKDQIEGIKKDFLAIQNVVSSALKDGRPFPCLEGNLINRVEKYSESRGEPFSALALRINFVRDLFIPLREAQDFDYRYASSVTVPLATLLDQVKDPSCKEILVQLKEELDASKKTLGFEEEDQFLPAASVEKFAKELQAILAKQSEADQNLLKQVVNRLTGCSQTNQRLLEVVNEVLEELPKVEAKINQMEKEKRVKNFVGVLEGFCNALNLSISEQRAFSKETKQRLTSDLEIYKDLSPDTELMELIMLALNTNEANASSQSTLSTDEANASSGIDEFDDTPSVDESKKTSDSDKEFLENSGLLLGLVEQLKSKISLIE